MQLLMILLAKLTGFGKNLKRRERVAFETQNKIPTFSPAAAGWKNPTDFFIGWVLPSAGKKLFWIAARRAPVFSLPEKPAQALNF